MDRPRPAEEVENNENESALNKSKGSVRFEVFGNAIIKKKVKVSGNSGRIYLPPDWVGHQVKIIRVD